MTESIFQTLNNVAMAAPDNVNLLRIIARDATDLGKTDRDILVRAADELEMVQRWNGALRAQVHEMGQREQSLLDRLKAHKASPTPIAEPLMVMTGAWPATGQFQQWVKL